MGTYSTGMKQRVKLAQALVHDPVLAFLDEPTAGPRSARPARDARADPPGRPRVRDQHRHLDAPDGRRRAGVRLGRRARRRPAAAHRRGVRASRRRPRRSRSSSSRAPRRSRTVSRARGLEPLLDGSRLTLDGVSASDYDVLRDAIVESGALLYRLAPGAALARRRLRDRAGRDAAKDERGVTSGPAEIFDLGYQGYEGERTSRVVATARDLARRGPDLARARARRRGEVRVLAAASAWRSCRWSSLVVDLGVRRAGASDSDDFELPVVRRVLRVGDRAARALRGGRRAAPALPRPPRRRARALRGAADHPARLRRLALGGVPHRRRSRAAWLPEAVLFAWNVLDALEHRVVARATTGTSCRGSSLPGRSSPSC